MDLPDTNIVVCPQCGSEFQPHITRCIDCGTPTQSAWASPGLHRKDRAQRPFSLPLETQAFVVSRSRDLRDAETLGDFLEEHGIPWRIEVSETEIASKKRFFYEVCVTGENLDRAAELEQELLFRQMPELEAAHNDPPTIDQCPACGSRVSPENEECPDCGLALNGPVVSTEEDTDSDW